VVSANQFTGSAPEGTGCTGIRVGASASHNTIVDNTLENYRGHIVLLGSDHNVVAGNQISRSWSSSILGDKMRFAGLILWNASGNQLLNNHIRGIEGAGIRLFAGSCDNRLEANTITDTEKEGIGIYFESDRNTVRNNSVQRNETAVKTSACSGNLLENNTLSTAFPVTVPQPQGQAEQIKFEPEIRIDDETIWLQEDITLRSPLLVAAGGVLTIQDSVLDIGIFEVEVRPGGRLVILDSTLRGKANIVVRNGAALRAENSQFYSLGEWDGGGALDIQGDNAVIRNNLFKGAYVAVQIRESTGHVISGNEIFNGSQGILVWDEQPNHNIRIEYNHVYNMLSGGIVGHALSGSTIVGNVLENIHGPAISIGTYSTGTEDQAGNAAYNNNLMPATYVLDYGMITSWSHDNAGNYWWDYHTRYPNARAHSQHLGVWDQAYAIGGNPSVSTVDGFPLIQPYVKVMVNGSYLQFDVPPTIIEGRTLVPLRGIFEALGVVPQWDGTTRTVTAKTDEVDMTLKIGSNVATVNGQDITLDVPSRIINGRTLVPARFIAESLGATVGWKQATRTVIIEDQP